MSSRRTSAGIVATLFAIAGVLLVGAASAAAETGDPGGAPSAAASGSEESAEPSDAPATAPSAGRHSAAGGSPGSSGSAGGVKSARGPRAAARPTTDSRHASEPDARAGTDTPPSGGARPEVDRNPEVPPPAASGRPDGESAGEPSDLADPPAGTARDDAETSAGEIRQLREPAPKRFQIRTEHSTLEQNTGISIRQADSAVVAAPVATRDALATRSTASATDEVSAPRAPSAIDLVGSLVMNVVVGLIHTIDGPPVLPPGSNVTVRTSSLDIPVAGGRTVEADWYFPNGPTPPTRLIYLQHGFGASSPMYSYTAAVLAEQTNSIVVAPSITSNFFDPDAAWLGGRPMQRAVADLFVGDRQALTQSASAAVGHDMTLPTRFVLAGHSMGGALVMGAAGEMVGNGAIDDLAGVLLLDSVDVDNTVPRALQQLSGVNYRPVYNISSERYVWNMYGRVADQLEAARPGQFNGVMLVGGRHIDGGQGGNPLLQFSEYLIAGVSQPRNVDAVQILAVGWVNDMFAGTHDGIYGAPQHVLRIGTPAGTAEAVVLPFTSTDTVYATPFDGVLAVILETLQKYFVYEPVNGAIPVAV
jgi:hypothetical protein